MTFTKNAHPLHVIGGIDTMDITKHIIIGGVNAIDIMKTSKTVVSTLLTSRKHQKRWCQYYCLINILQHRLHERVVVVSL